MVIKGLDKFKRDYPRVYKGVKYAGNALQIAGKAYTLAQTVASIINSERKYFDTQINVPPDTTASITHLSAIAAGTAENQRVGNSVAIKTFQYRGIVSQDGTLHDESIRIIIFEDRNNNGGTPPTAAQLLQDPTGTAAIFSLRNMDGAKRFKVFHDKVYTSDPVNGSRNHLLEYFKKFKTQRNNRGLKIRNHHITWTGTAGTDEDKNHIYMLVVSNYATASTTSNVVGNFRIRFYDN